MEEKIQSTPKKQFICDPSANISCSRQGCVLMGGTCFTTPNVEFATSDHNGLPEEATPRKVLEMENLIAGARHIRPSCSSGYTTSVFVGEKPNHPVPVDIGRVIRVRRSVANRSVTAMVLKGTPGSTPVAPTLSRVADGNWDIAVADVAVNAAVTSIVSGDITSNLLNTEVCGVSTARTDFDLSAFQTQFEALLDEIRYDLTQIVIGAVMAHKTTHFTGGADAIAPSDIGAESVRLTFTDQSVTTSGWATYTASGTEETAVQTAGYIYRKSLPLTGILATMFIRATLSINADSCGTTLWRNVLPYDGGIKIYAKGTPSSAFTILMVNAWKAVS